MNNYIALVEMAVTASNTCNAMFEMMHEKIDMSLARIHENIVKEMVEDKQINEEDGKRVLDLMHKYLIGDLELTETEIKEHHGGDHWSTTPLKALISPSESFSEMTDKEYRIAENVAEIGQWVAYKMVSKYPEYSYSNSQQVNNQIIQWAWELEATIPEDSDEYFDHVLEFMGNIDWADFLSRFCEKNEKEGTAC